MPIELRDLEQPVINDLIERIRKRAVKIGESNNLSIDIELFGTEAPAPTDAALRDLIEKVAAEAGFSTLRMPSGAGHDAQVVSHCGIPTGMIFVPSQDGISHSPREWTDWEDCARGVEVLYRAVRGMDKMKRI
jgi:N-carbamoyl-L-amino-acid hydrolase